MRRRWIAGFFVVVVAVAVLAAIGFAIGRFAVQSIPHQDRANAAAAQGDVNAIELALTKVLVDAGARDLESLLVPGSLPPANTAAAVEEHTRVFTDLLRRGRDSDAPVQPERLPKLAAHYLDVPLDPWGHPYRIVAGPWRDENGPHPLCMPDIEPGVSSQGRSTIAPAPRLEPFFVFSCGKDGRPDQPYAASGHPLAPEHFDDITSWNVSDLIGIE